PAHRIRAVTVPSVLDVYLTDQQSQATSVQLIDMNGRMMAQSRVQSVTGTIKVTFNTSALTNGIYIIRAQNQKGVVTQRVLIWR
ncbi:MAG TPA: T9SS type A sorting domain-containing protein, partial [Lacibacter sp.]|nr:T9SS type A sorting domain-containing protein [Lacibacter sp.]